MKHFKSSLSHFFVGLLWSGTAVLHYWSINGKLHHILSFFKEALPIIVVGAVLYWLLSFFILCKATKNPQRWLSVQLGFSIFFLFIGPHRQLNHTIHGLLFLTYVSILGFLVIWLCWRFHQKVKPLIFIFLLAFGASRAYESLVFLNEQYQDYQALKASFSRESAKEFLDKFKQHDDFQHKFNIYQLSTDSYPSLVGIKRFGIDNSDFYQWLDEKGFRTYPNAASNSADTFRTLNMMWRMELSFPEHLENLTYESYFGKNEVFARLINQNYAIYCDYPCTAHERSPKPPIFANLKPASGTNTTYSFFTGYFFGYYFSNELVEWLAGPRDAMPNETGAYVDSYLNAQADFQLLKQAGLVENTYIFLHNITEFPRLQSIAESINSGLKTIIEDILKKDPGSMIIVSSDHGNRPEWTVPYGDIPLHNFGVIQAIYWPQVCRRFRDVEVLTGVNFFRYIFACLNGWKKPKHLEPNDGHMVYVSKNADFQKYNGIFLGVKNGKFLDYPKEINGKFSQQEIIELLTDSSQHNIFTKKLYSVEGESAINSTGLRHLCDGGKSLCIMAPSEVIYPLEGDESHLSFSYGIEENALSNQHEGIYFQIFLKSSNKEEKIWESFIEPQQRYVKNASIEIPMNTFQEIRFKNSCPKQCVEAWGLWGDFKIR